MRQYQGRARCKRAENMRGLAVLEGIEALPQRLAVDGDVPLAPRGRLLVKDGSMVAERLLNRSGVELAENVSDGRIGRRPTPFQPEEPAQTNEMDIDETMDTPVRVGPGYHRQNSEQDHMWQTIQLAFSPSRAFDFGQHRQKRGELHGTLGSSDSGCLSKSQRFGVAGILNRLAQRHFTRGCGNLDSPFKYRALHSRGMTSPRSAIIRAATKKKKSPARTKPSGGVSLGGGSQTRRK